MKILLMLLIVMLSALIGPGQPRAKQDEEGKSMGEERTMTRIATFAGGCFWCTEADFEKVPGVVEVVSGYTGGHKENPSYKEVSSGTTGHLEAVQVHYDPSKRTYQELLDVFWRHIDPMDSGGQFVDRGSQYRTAIFYHDEKQRRLAEESKETLSKSGRFDKPIVTEILPFTRFYEAEKYHQDYYKNHSLRYKYYRYGSGRDQFLEKVWGKDMKNTTAAKEQRAYTKPDDATLGKVLSPLQYEVTQNNGTEPPFQNEYWDNKRRGFTSTSFPGNPCSARWTNSIPGPDGRASPSPLNRTILLKRRTGASS